MNVLYHKGISVVEAVVSISVFAVLSLVAYETFVASNTLSVQSGNNAEAVWLAEEGLEAVRSIRDSDFANLSAGTHGIATSSSGWLLSGSSDTRGVFTRAITLSSIDADTFDVTSEVTWTHKGTVRTKTLTSRVTNWLQEVAGGVGDWSTPTLSASLDVSGGSNGFKIQANDTHAFMVRTGGNPDFVVFDISSPDAPTEVAGLSLSGSPRNIFINSTHAYVVGTDNSEEMQIIDISDPTSPSLVGTYNDPGSNNAVGVFVVDTTAYVTLQGGDDFAVVDVSVPALPVRVGFTSLSSSPNEVFVSGSHAYVASNQNDEELQVVDISNPLLPIEVATLDLSGNGNGVTVTGAGSVLVMGRGGGSLHTIDISTPTAPTLLGTYNFGSTVRDVALGNSNTYVFAGGDTNSREFQVIDISTPTSPVQVGVFDDTDNGDVNGVAYVETHDRAFLASEENDTELIVMRPAP